MRILGALLSLPFLACAQYYNISTIAGVGRIPFNGGGKASGASLVEPRTVAVDAAGNVYFVDTYYQQVLQISPAGTINVYAGSGNTAFAGDGGPAAAASLHNPLSLVVDSGGNLYIADYSNGRVRKVSPNGTITTVAGNGAAGVAGDGGPATSAAVGGPYGLAIDAAGNLYISQSFDDVIRMVDTTGKITTIAGKPDVPGFSGDGGPATAATLFTPEGIKVDASGDLYVADSENQRIRKISPQGTITTLAGNGKFGFSGDGQQATAASVANPADVGLDASGNVYIVDVSNGRIRMVNSSGVISTFAGGGSSTTDGPALQANLGSPTGIAVDGQGNVYVALNTFREVRRVTPQQTIATIAGASPGIRGGDNLPAVNAALYDPYGIAVDAGGGTSSSRTF